MNALHSALQVQVSKLIRRKKDEFIPLVMSRTIELWTAVIAAERPEEFFGRAFWTAAVMRGLSAFQRSFVDTLCAISHVTAVSRPRAEVRDSLPLCQFGALTTVPQSTVRAGALSDYMPLESACDAVGVGGGGLHAAPLLAC